MCLNRPLAGPLAAPWTAAPATHAALAAIPAGRALPVEVPPAGSRRRRLWELDAGAHCPVVGVCLPIATLRRLAAKPPHRLELRDDHALHTTVVGECRRRTPLAEAVQKELEQRYRLAVQRAAQWRSADALSEGWREASAGKDLPAALWATLTHPRCTTDLERRVLGEVHMLQHQVGMATRAELARFEALIDENAVLARELAGAQQRSRHQAEEATRRIEALKGERMHWQSLLAGRDAELARLRDALSGIEAASPDARSRVELAHEVRLQAELGRSLQRALMQARQQADRQRRRADALQAALQAAAVTPAPAAAAPQRAADLAERAVLCVGGRPASVPVYRQVVEDRGARFLHHDGGDEQSQAQLDATLAAADLVICQTGCISHEAYWRVKEHCKRTGKRCVFVETPSRSALERALAGTAGEGGR